MHMFVTLILLILANVHKPEQWHEEQVNLKFL